jgi:vWA-MoxR associated protein C-terminal domain/Trypsin-like peptidase domain
VLDRRRVAEIVVLSAKERGTGYVLCDRCILTAYHVVCGAANSTASDAIKFRLLGDETWCSASLAWSDAELDVALLEFTHSFSTIFDDLPRLISPETHRKRVACNAVGFPEFRKEKREKTFFEDYCLEGWIKPTDFDFVKKPSQLLMEVEGAIPSTVESWQGVSGGAVFSTDGDLLGVLLRVPRDLGGQQIHAISLNWLVDRHPSFSQELLRLFKQSFEIDDRQRQIYSLKEELRVRKKRRIANDARKHQIEEELEELEGNERLSGHDPIKEELKQGLIAIERCDSKILVNVWTYLENEHDVNSTYKFELNAKNICDELGVAIDKTLTYRFLERAIALLQRKDPTDEVTALIDRLKNPLSMFPQPEPQAAKNELPSDPIDTQPAPSNVTSLLLFGLEIVKTESDRVEYSLSIHHVPDSTAYQQHINDPEDSLEDMAKPLQVTADELNDLGVQPDDRNRLTFSAKLDDMDVIREILNTTVQAVFDIYPELEDNRPHIYFYLPKSLLTLDCHNFTFDCDDGYLRLGRQHPVAIACLDRHKQPRSSKPRRKWEKRWKDRNDAKKALRDHICSCDKQLKELNSEFLSFDDRNILSSQLQILDRERGKIIGLQFTENNLRFQVAYETFFLVGLSLFLYPSSPLTQTDMDRLSKVLGETCVDRFLVAIKDWYRINPESHDARSLSVLLDNPYLPLPEIDYF